MSAAADTVVAYLRTQAEVIAGRSDDVLEDAPDAVHKSRVATRRSRSALRTFAPLFGKAPVKALRDELAWHADRLGAPRDAEVLRERLLAALAELPADRVSGPVRERLTRQLVDAHDAAHASLVDSMRTPRYADLRHALADFVANPPVKAAMAEAGRDVLADLLGRAVERVRRLAVRAEEVPDDLHHWHEVRKAAKAARYCSEAVQPAFGDPAADLIAAWEAVTEQLGQVQDTVVAEQTLIQHAAAALDADEPVETYLALEGVELRIRERALVAARDALQHALSLPPLPR